MQHQLHRVNGGWPGPLLPGARKFTAVRSSAASPGGGSERDEGKILLGQVPPDARRLCLQPPVRLMCLTSLSGLKSPPENGAGPPASGTVVRIEFIHVAHLDRCLAPSRLSAGAP